MGALDELLAKWRDNPDAGTTLALCTYLGSSQREDLIREVGSTSEAWHKEDPQVMLATGRMYLDAGLLQEAQAALVAAGKIRPNDAAPYRYLGEVLLRRGDAARAEKVLARALTIGGGEADTRMWHDRAGVYVALQQRVGMRAVADEIDRTIPKKNSIPPPTLSADEADRLALAAGAARARAGGGARLPSVPPPPKLVPSTPPPPAPGRAPAHRAPPAPAPPAPPLRAAAPPAPSAGRLPAFSENEIPTGVFDAHTLARERSDEVTEVTPFAALPNRSRSAPPASLASSRPLPPPPTVPPSSAPPPRIPAPPLAVPRAPRVPQIASRAGFDDDPEPAAETVLEHLARVGVFEKGGGAPPAWAAPPRERPRGAWVFAGAIVLAAGAGYGAFAYVQKVKAERMAMARGIETEVKKLLKTGQLEALKKTDGELSRAFDLDSRSQQAAVLWLQNRVLSALLLPGEPRGIESALARCKTLGVPDDKTVFGKITSFLAEGDLAGAAAILPKWDEKAKSDPFYHLAAGAMLERAGDVRAIGRYKQAFDLDPELLVARMFHASLATLELGIDTGKPVIEDASKRLGDSPAARALVGLGWAIEAASPDALPDNANVAEADRARLPAQFLAIPHVVDARVALRAGRQTDALAALDKGLRLTATPAVASFIGQVAIELGDEQLARAATLRALSYSAIYPRARSLAARVALLGARLDEAKKAIQELDAESQEVAVVRAAAAYESLDLSELESAIEVMGKEGPGSALGRGMDLVLGRALPDAKTLEQMAVPSVPWGDLIAVDAALDAGNLGLAEQIASRWGARTGNAAHALRYARLLRYQGKAELAVNASADAVVAGGVTSRVLVERFRSLLAAEDVKGARELLGQYPAVLGPLTDFLKISADVADGKAARAKGMAARLEPLPEGSPFLLDLIAAEALAGVGDRRGKPLVQRLLRMRPRHPDVVAAARAAGLVP